MPSRPARHRPLPGVAPLAAFGLGFAAVALMLAADGRHPAAANETRTLTIHHTHTRENITVTFKRNGRYDEAGLARLNHFLRDWRNDEATKMDPRLFDVVWEVYRDVGATQPVQIISAYRSPQTNAMLRRRSRGVARFSQHMLGKAIDFNIPGASLERVRNAGLRQQRGGVGFYPSSGSPFVHVDVGSVRHWPRLSPDALARVFPDGRTVHIPSDGRPLRGYDLALADLTRRGASPSRVALAAASDDGAGTARSKPRRGWFARLLGAGGNDEDEEETRETPASARPKAEPRAVQVATAVPMPRARPSDEPSAVAVASAPTTASQIVAARGLWQAAETMAASDAPPVRTVAAGPPVRPPSDAPRMMWQVGPQPVVVASADSTAVPKRVPAPRPRPEIARASADPATTATVPWPIGGREDRVPSDLVLAYAAAPPAESGARPAAAPMGLLRPAQAAAAAVPIPKPAPTARPAPARRPAATPRQLAENPWLRGIILASRMHNAMSVTVLGPPNYLTLTPLMHKPPSAVANAFADDPEFGLAMTAFSGPAVSFIPLVTFGTVTAGLN